eukprot:Pgem_evm1s277
MSKVVNKFEKTNNNDNNYYNYNSLESIDNEELPSYASLDKIYLNTMQTQTTKQLAKLTKLSDLTVYGKEHVTTNTIKQYFKLWYSTLGGEITNNDGFETYSFDSTWTHREKHILNEQGEQISTIMYRFQDCKRIMKIMDASGTKVLATLVRPSFFNITCNCVVFLHADGDIDGDIDGDNYDIDCFLKREPDIVIKGFNVLNWRWEVSQYQTGFVLADITKVSWIRLDYNITVYEGVDVVLMNSILACLMDIFHMK